MARRIAVAAALSLAMSALGVATASAAPRTTVSCKEESLANQTIRGTVIAERECTLFRVTIEGELVVAGFAATLSESTVRGPVRGTTIYEFDIEHSTITRSIDLPAANVVIGTSTVGGHVFVEAGRLEDSRVARGMHVTGGTTALSHADLGGGLSATRAMTVDVDESEVDGSIVVTGGATEATVEDATVDGDVRLSGLSSSFGYGVLEVDHSTVAGNVNLSNDSLGGGGPFNFIQAIDDQIGGNLMLRHDTASGSSNNAVSASEDTVGGHITCRYDSPLPIGGANTASELRGECAGL